MKKSTAAAILASLLLSLSASTCNAKETEEVKPVSWYQDPANEAALNAKLAQCKENPGELRDTPNCINARKAFQNIFKGGKFEKVKEPRFGF